MNYRKIIILPSLFFLSHLVYIGCCKCTDAVLQHYDLHDVHVTVFGSGRSVIDTGAITRVDTVFLNYSFTAPCVAKKNSLDFLINQASACKCVECGREEGIKSKISSITITSDSVYNAIPANSPLNALFKVQDDNGYVRIDTIQNRINNNNYKSRLFSLQLITTTKPGNTKGHVFKLNIILADGRQLSAATKRIYWQ